MPIRDYQATYERHLAKLIDEHGRERAMELVVGGKYHESGRLEAWALRQLGLRPENSVVDVGCGSGRLALGLEGFLTGKFVGTDVLAEALDYARSRCGRRDWEFIHTSGKRIPVADNTADFVVFFSVFTHLLDEDVFRYLCESRRIAKPTGKIVFSYLDFECDGHWPLFLQTAADERPDRVLNSFTTETAIRRLARGAGLMVRAFHPSGEKWISVEGPILSEDDSNARGPLEFGQSIAVLEIFPEDRYLALYPDVDQAVKEGTFRSGSHHYDVCGYKEGRRVPGVV